MINDTGTCPACDRSFPVTRYGHQIPCPHCDELLDIAPDTPRARGPGLTAVQWQEVFQAEIVYLTTLATEVKDFITTESIAGAAEYLTQLTERISRLQH